MTNFHVLVQTSFYYQAKEHCQSLVKRERRGYGQFLDNNWPAGLAIRGCLGRGTASPYQWKIGPPKNWSPGPKFHENWSPGPKFHGKLVPRTNFFMNFCSPHGFFNVRRLSCSRLFTACYTGLYSYCLFNKACYTDKTILSNF